MIDRKLEHLQPSFLAKVEKWLNDVEYEFPKRIFINETLRSYARSDELYALGRTVPNTQKVTNAKGGQSMHNFGLALDIYPTINGKAIYNFDRDPALMKMMFRVADLATKHGIEWGGKWKSFKDLPHFQDSKAPALADCRKLWPKGYVPKAGAK